LIPVNVEGQIEAGEPKELADRMEHHSVPGVSIALINDFHVEWANGYGVLVAGGDETVSTDTLFHAGSIAKPVSAAATLALVGRGILDLDENVNEKLISWRVPENEYTDEEKVTLRRLLSHSGGIEDGFTDRSSSEQVPGYMTSAGESPTITLQQLLDADAGVDVDGITSVTSVPGTTYRYANANYAIVELLIVDVTKQPFPEFMSDTILIPLGMTSSTFEQPLPEDLRNRATIEHDAGGQPFEGERVHLPYLATGGLWTTPSDLALFAIEIMHSYKGHSDKILPPELANEMLTPQIAIPNNPLGDYFGLGFELAGEGKDLVFLHPGGTWGSTCVLWVYPETGQGAVIMTNSASGQGMIVFEILLSLAVEYGWPLTPPSE
jgi:CubicO group peptidase (beta-lactamase class C family)